MRCIHISSQKILAVDSILEINQFKYNQIELGLNEGLVEFIEKNISSSSSNDLLIINIESPRVGTNRQNLQGIKLIKCLRLLGLINPILAYSTTTPSIEYYFDNNSGSGSPGNLILTSPGIKFLWIQHISKVNFDNLKPISQDAIQNLKSYFKIDYSLPKDERHNWANWWGSYQTTRILQILFPQEPIFLPPFEKTINNLTALFLNDINEKTLSNELYYEAAISGEIRNEIKKLDTIIKNETNEEIIEIKRNRRDLIMIGRPDAIESLTQPIKKLQSKKLKVALIDDEASIGWGQLFKYLFKAEKEDFFIFHEFNFSKENKLRDVKKFVTTELEQLINPQRPQLNLIILDLRLKKGDIELTGVHVLEEIRKINRFIPIIVVSASNKYDSYRIIFQNKASAFWNKPGLDIINTPQECILRLKQLISILNNLTEGVLSFIQETYLFLERSRNLSTPFWWQQAEHINKIAKRTSEIPMIQQRLSTKVIYRIFTNVLEQIDLSYKNSYLYGYEASYFMHNLIALRAYHSIECAQYRANGSEGLEERGDFLSILITYIRNDLAHESPKYLTLEELCFYFNTILSHLLNTEMAVIPKFKPKNFYGQSLTSKLWTMKDVLTQHKFNFWIKPDNNLFKNQTLVEFCKHFKLDKTKAFSIAQKLGIEPTEITSGKKLCEIRELLHKTH